MKRSHLTRKKDNAWKYFCISTCSGEHFYCPQNPTQISFYRIHHNGND